MMGKIFFICVFALVCAGCADYGRELAEMKSLVAQQQKQLEEYREQMQQLAELKQKAQSLQLIFSEILQRLDRLDQSMYQGRYIGALGGQKGGSKEFVAAYVTLIDQVEKDLAQKTEK